MITIEIRRDTFSPVSSQRRNILDNLKDLYTDITDISYC